MEDRATQPVGESGPEDRSLRRKLLLVATLPFPLDPDRPAANSFKILRHAMRCAGHWTKEIEEIEEIAYNHDAELPLFQSWYQSLIAMTSPVDDEPLLVKGFGNLITPAHPLFTACFLTQAGREVAEAILHEHPEWRSPESYNQ